MLHLYKRGGGEGLSRGSELHLLNAIGYIIPEEGDNYHEKA